MNTALACAIASNSAAVGGWSRGAVAGGTRSGEQRIGAPLDALGVEAHHIPLTPELVDMLRRAVVAADDLGDAAPGPPGMNSSTPLRWVGSSTARRPGRRVKRRPSGRTGSTGTSRPLHSMSGISGHAVHCRGCRGDEAFAPSPATASAPGRGPNGMRPSPKKKTPTATPRKHRIASPFRSDSPSLVNRRYGVVGSLMRRAGNRRQLVRHSACQIKSDP
jgi:hypothetical protein